MRSWSGSGEWGQRWATAQFAPDNLDLTLLMWNVRRRIDFHAAAQAARGRALRLSRRSRRGAGRFRTCWLVLERGGSDVCMKDPGFEVDLVVAADVGALARVWTGRHHVRAGGAGGRPAAGGRARPRPRVSRLAAAEPLRPRAAARPRRLNRDGRIATLARRARPRVWALALLVCVVACASPATTTRDTPAAGDEPPPRFAAGGPDAAAFGAAPGYPNGNRATFFDDRVASSARTATSTRSSRAGSFTRRRRPRASCGSPSRASRGSSRTPT